jgi:AcrR family transcriptional regulator
MKNLENKKTSMSETDNNRQLWIEKGYEHFALYGPENLSIKKLSKSVGLSRASFYHHFGDLDCFIEELLGEHYGIIETFNCAGKNKCNNLFPDLYDLIAQYPLPLKFILQLFRNRSKPHFNLVLIKSYESTANSFALKLFSKHLELTQPHQEIYHLWLTLGEAWYSRISPEDLSAQTLQEHSKEILKTLSVLIGSPLYTELHKPV